MVMAENDETLEDLETVEVPAEPYESEGARRLRIRAEAKEAAEPLMAAEAKKAQSRKAKRLRGVPEIEGLADFNKRGLEIEKSINAKADDKKEG